MPRIRCLYIDCTFLDNNYCSAPKVEIDPDIGCTTYVPLGEANLLEDDWTEDDDDFDNWTVEDVDEEFTDDEENW